MFYVFAHKNFNCATKTSTVQQKVLHGTRDMCNTNY